ncbi:hypothetical protein [Streptomyces laurentii]|uniref:hypothetical protein n=1 Tax=Streptomyces laurentii TaxID=39478 RepID=UPI0033EC61A0
MTTEAPNQEKTTPMTSAPTPEYGAPYIPTTTTRSTTMTPDAALDLPPGTTIDTCPDCGDTRLNRPGALDPWKGHWPDECDSQAQQAAAQGQHRH